MGLMLATVVQLLSVDNDIYTSMVIFKVKDEMYDIYHIQLNIFSVYLQPTVFICLNNQQHHSSFVISIEWTGISGNLSGKVTQCPVKTTSVISLLVFGQKYNITTLS